LASKETENNTVNIKANCTIFTGLSVSDPTYIRAKSNPT